MFSYGICSQRVILRFFSHTETLLAPQARFSFLGFCDGEPYNQSSLEHACISRLMKGCECLFTHMSEIFSLAMIRWGDVLDLVRVHNNTRLTRYYRSTSSSMHQGWNSARERRSERYKGGRY